MRRLVIVVLMDCLVVVFALARIWKLGETCVSAAVNDLKIPKMWGYALTLSRYIKSITPII
jgi:hypothetical protein